MDNTKRMCRIILIIFFVCATLVSCTNGKSEDYYKDLFEINKADLYEIRDSIRFVINKEHRIYKYRVNYTGKRLIKYSYNTDSTQWDFSDATLSDENADWIMGAMHRHNLSNIWVYRDSTKFYFKGANSDVIVVYDKGPRIPNGEKIEDRVYLLRKQLN